MAEFVRRAVREALPIPGKSPWMKFAGLVEGVLPAAQVRTLMDLCWKVDSLPNAAQVAAAAGAV